MFGFDPVVLAIVALAAIAAGAVCYGLLFTRMETEKKSANRVNRVASAEADKAGVKAGETMKEQFNCEYDAWVSLEQPEIGEPNEQRMGGYREGFQSVCPGEIKNLKKVGFDATLTQAQTLMTDVLTTLRVERAHNTPGAQWLLTHQRQR